MFPGEEVLERLFLVDRSHDGDERLCGEDADVDLGGTEGGFLACDDDVAGGGQAHPAGQTVPLDGGDGQGGSVDGLLDELFHAGEALAVGFRPLSDGARHRLDVAAGTEGTLCAADDDHACGAVVGEIEDGREAVDDVVV